LKLRYGAAVAQLDLMERGPQFVRFDDVLSANLTVRLRLHSFSFFVAARQPKSIAVISGTGFAGASFQWLVTAWTTWPERDLPLFLR
jgi:hypothetical protein